MTFEEELPGELTEGVDQLLQKCCIRRAARATGNGSRATVTDLQKNTSKPCNSVNMSFTHARKAQNSLLERTLFVTRHPSWLHSANRTSGRYRQHSEPAEQDLQLTSFLS